MVCFGVPQANARDPQGQASPRLRALGAGLWVRLLVLLLLGFGSAVPAEAVAQEPVPYAGIVIRSGDGTVTYGYVPLDEPVSGIELLRRSGISLVTVGFGGLGEGVCQIEETGCEIGPCRSRLCQTGDRDSPYWRYFQFDGSGQWVASPLGGSATRVEPGGVDGWSWTPDESLLPSVDISEIPELAGAGTALDQSHFARYDMNGNQVANATVLGPEKRSYLAVIGVLAAVAVLALVLRMRSTRAPV